MDNEERPQTAAGREERRSVYFFLLNRLKRFSLSFSRFPGLDSAVEAATVAGSVWARGAGAGVLWLLGVTSTLEPAAATMAEIQEFISSWRRGGKALKNRNLFNPDLFNNPTITEQLRFPGSLFQI